MPQDYMNPEEPERPDRNRLGGQSRARHDDRDTAVLAAAAEEAEELLSSGGVTDAVVGEAQRRIRRFLDAGFA